ncbi:MAG: hypothetical protein Q7S23_01575 [bacterium]|nr:hypothetical protein [bacterium]
MEQGSTGNPSGVVAGGSPSAPKKSFMKPLIVAIVVVAVAGLAYYYRVVLTPGGTPLANTNESDGQVAGATASPTPVVTPVTTEERQEIGSLSVLVKPGMLVRENDALRTLFSANGVQLVAVRSIGNKNFDEVSAKVQAGEIEMAEALKEYWRLDVLEIGNPDQEDVATWITAHWPPYDAPNIEVKKSTAKVDGVATTVHAVTHTDLTMLQTIYFLQPKDKGNMLIISSFQGSSKPFAKEIDGLVQSVKFN